jgi:hypothetical protein
MWIGDYAPQKSSPTITQPKRKTMYLQHYPPFLLTMLRTSSNLYALNAETEYCSQTISANKQKFDQNHQNIGRGSSSGGKRPHRQQQKRTLNNARPHSPSSYQPLDTLRSPPQSLLPPKHIPPNTPNHHPGSKRDNCFSGGRKFFSKFRQRQTLKISDILHNI